MDLVKLLSLLKTHSQAKMAPDIRSIRHAKFATEPETKDDEQSIVSVVPGSLNWRLRHAHQTFGRAAAATLGFTAR
jgi:hypothetical protein